MSWTRSVQLVHLACFVGMSEQKEKQYIFVQHFDPASHEFLIFFCATVRPWCLWQSHKDECGLRSSSWFPSGFLAEGGLPRWGVERNVHGDPDGVRWWRCGAGGPHGVWLGWRRSMVDASAWVVGLHLLLDHCLLPLCSLVLFSLSHLFLVALQQQETRDHLWRRWSHEGRQKWYILHKNRCLLIYILYCWIIVHTFSSRAPLRLRPHHGNTELPFTSPPTCLVLVHKCLFVQITYPCVCACVAELCAKMSSTKFRSLYKVQLSPWHPCYDVIYMPPVSRCRWNSIRNKSSISLIHAVL